MSRMPLGDPAPRAAAVLTDVVEERLPVPGKAHLPHDVWLRGTYRPPAGKGGEV
ncbi:hypothetical protein [Segeticoccus rhizosphaerae]|uniref:hypothetical protein n=1 Tax=Segeticoccus rhizosphaerae TaxID=1104777 RepID=UPI0013906434|nr:MULTISPECIES: hypothetical protein [Intrasporangiaceae]